MQSISPVGNVENTLRIADAPLVSPEWNRPDPPLTSRAVWLVRSLALALMVAAAATLWMLASSRFDQTSSSTGARTPSATASATLAEPAVDAADFVEAINAIRRSHDLPALEQDAGLTDAAQSWAGTLSDRRTLGHAPDVRVGAPKQWTKLGENIGSGTSVSQIMTAFQESNEHLQTLVDPTHSLIGVGIAEDVDGTLWTVHRFASVFHETEELESENAAGS